MNVAATWHRIRVTGRVHGVGFRPFVWRLASAAGLSGQVRNDAAGVLIELWGSTGVVETFLSALQADAPLLAKIESFEQTALDAPPPKPGFEILPSVAGPVSTEIVPDAATCPDCLTDIFDPDNRRYLYPFTNCTNCGPRLSIVRAIPYDRANTSMASFKMCSYCRAEYENPRDRRFHAQPIACPDCGPQIWLEDRDGTLDGDDPIAEAARRLNARGIVAIKGIGGFHLACDATSPEAIATLRSRKRRSAKPFALMIRNLTEVRRYCRVTEAEAEELCSSAAPIVLLEAQAESLPPGIAPGLDKIGVILPYSPLHHLLMAQLDQPIVLTSGNPASSPQLTSNTEARRDLAGIADVWLMHDRDVLTRVEDSLVLADNTGGAVLRRARGLAPEPLQLPAGLGAAPPVLAMGGGLKSSFGLLAGGRCTLSPHIGDLSNAATFTDYRRMIAQYLDLFEHHPEIVAVDLHPDCSSVRWGRVLAAESGAVLVGVQHHHAHLASCLAENLVACDAGPTVGIVLDGTGFGPDATSWGGEILVGNYHEFARRAHFPAVPLPGGEQAAREPWRNTVAHLITHFGENWRLVASKSRLLDYLPPDRWQMMETMIRKGLNAPLSSSAGRFFDAVAGALGFAGHQQFEGHAAMELEAMARPYFEAANAYPVEIKRTDGMLVPCWRNLWLALGSDLGAGKATGMIAARFHRGLVAALVVMASQVAEEAGTRRIALTGGVMQNRLLLNALLAGLRDAGFDVLVQAKVPSNDGGLALGQGAVAVARLK